MDMADPWLAPTRDHVIPRKHGGDNGEIRPACAKCNTIKAHMMPDRWVLFMALNPSWWLLGKRALRTARGRLPPKEPEPVRTGISTVVPANLVYGRRPVIPHYACGKEKAHPPMADALQQLKRDDQSM